MNSIFHLISSVIYICYGLHYAPPPQKKISYIEFLVPGHQNVTLFGNIVIEDVISLDEVRLE